jgi:hypothetical protein
MWITFFGFGLNENLNDFIKLISKYIKKVVIDFKEF